MAYGFTYTLPTITGSHSDFPVLLVDGNFPTAAVDGGANSILNGGGNLRAYTDDTKATQLPLEVVTFVTGGTPDVQAWVKIPTAATGNTIYLEADSVATSQPAVTDTYGRNAVWADYEAVYHLNDTSPVDSSGNSTPTVNGTLTAVAGVAGVGAVKFNSSGNASINMGVVADTIGDLSVTAWVNVDGTTSTASIVGRRQTAWNWQHALRSRKPAMLAGSGFKVSTSTIPTATWKKITTTISGTLESFYTDGSANGTATVSGTRSLRPTVDTEIGARNTSSDPIGGSLFGVRIRLDVLSVNWESAEYDNQSDPSNWGTSSSWADSGGGLVLTPTGIPTAESFGGLSVITGGVSLSLTAIDTEEVVGAPVVVSAGITLQPNGIVSLEVVNGPTLLVGAILVSPSSITTQELVGDPTLITGSLILTPDGVVSAEQFGTLNLKFAQVVEVISVTTGEVFGTAIIQDGIALVIPVDSRQTYQAMQRFLDSTGQFVSEQNNEILVEWLKSEGIPEGAFNDMFYEYWEGSGYDGTYSDKWKKWVDNE